MCLQLSTPYQRVKIGLTHPLVLAFADNVVPQLVGMVYSDYILLHWISILMGTRARTSLTPWQKCTWRTVVRPPLTRPHKWRSTTQPCTSMRKATLLRPSPSRSLTWPSWRSRNAWSRRSKLSRRKSLNFGRPKRDTLVLLIITLLRLQTRDTSRAILWQARVQRVSDSIALQPGISWLPQLWLTS